MENIKSFANAGLSVQEATEAMRQFGELCRLAGDALLELVNLTKIRPSGFVLVKNRFESELLSWGMPEAIASWLVWNLPYRYINLCVRVMKR